MGLKAVARGGGGAGTVTGITGSAPITVDNTNPATPIIGITQATTSTDGYLSSTDWNTFNSKFNLPTLTAGSVLFSDGATIAQNNANFFWDDSNNRLGIGTATPTVAFEIARPSVSNQLLIKTVTSGIASLSIQDQTGGTILLRGDTNDSYINAGNFAIGATSATAGARLDILAPTLTGSSTAAGFLFRQTYNTSGVTEGATFAYTNSASNNASRWLRVTVGGTEAFSVGRTSFSTGAVRLNTALMLSTSGGQNIYHGGSGGTAFYNFDGSVSWASIGSTGVFAQTPVALTGSLATSAHSITQTYNTSGQPAAFDINITNTASSASSTYATFRTGATNGFRFVISSAFLQFGGGGNNTGIGAANSAGTGSATGTSIRYLGSAGGNTGYDHHFSAVAGRDSTSGTLGIINATGTFNPASGTSIFALLNIVSTINQTGGANGIASSISNAPTLTAAADYRFITSTQGRIRLSDTYGSGSGSLAYGLLDLTQTLNTSGAPTIIKLNVTDTASDAATLLMDLQVGGTSQFSVSKIGTAVHNGVVRLKGYTVATLPAGTQGDTAYVTDALAPTFLAVLVGGGAITTTCFYNGANWVAQ